MFFVDMLRQFYNILVKYWGGKILLRVIFVLFLRKLLPEGCQYLNYLPEGWRKKRCSVIFARKFPFSPFLNEIIILVATPRCANHPVHDHTMASVQKQSVQCTVKHTVHCTCMQYTVPLYCTLYLCTVHCTCVLYTVPVYCTLYLCTVHCTCVLYTVPVYCTLSRISCVPYNIAHHCTEYLNAVQCTEFALFCMLSINQQRLFKSPICSLFISTLVATFSTVITIVA